MRSNRFMMPYGVDYSFGVKYYAALLFIPYGRRAHQPFGIAIPQGVARGLMVYMAFSHTTNADNKLWYIPITPCKGSMLTQQQRLVVEKTYQ